MNWIYLSKNGDDEYINMFARGAGAKPTKLETWDYSSSSNPLVLRGIMKHKIIKRCWEDARSFRYMDTGYFGNKASRENPNGWKHWHRIVDNDLQHHTVIRRPDNRWRRLDINISHRKYGSKILIAAPDEKPCIFYGINLDQWLDQTISTIRQYTDREIVIRQRDPNRQTRQSNSLEEALHDVHALVTFNSIAASEAVIAGVPAFALAPCNAAMPVSNTNLKDIDNPWFPDKEQTFERACHLAYGKFHIDELRDGKASRILEQTKEILNA